MRGARGIFEGVLQGIFEKGGAGWEVKKLGEVCELKSGTTIDAKLEKTSGEVIYAKVGDMNFLGNEVFMNSSSRFVNFRDISEKQIIPVGSIIFPKRGGAIATNKKRRIVKPTIVDLNTMALVPKSIIDKDYLFHWFRLIDLAKLSNGTSIPQINNYSFDEVYIPFPKSKTEQTALVATLDHLRAETQKLETLYQKKLTALDELKKSLLAEAFSVEGK